MAGRNEVTYVPSLRRASRARKANPRLCRRRHNLGHADLRVMPTSTETSLSGAAAGRMGSA
jgi:hypothetical protein